MNQNTQESINTLREQLADINRKLEELTAKSQQTAKKDNRPVTERILTFEDACEELGHDHPLVATYDNTFTCIDAEIDNSEADVEAYLKLRIITAALNEGWEPQFTEDEVRWIPWFFLYTEEEMQDKDEEWRRKRAYRRIYGYRGEYAGLAYAYSGNAPSRASSYIGSRLCLRTEALADHAAHTFPELYADFYLLRK